jgi:hypothetical protein
VVEDGRVTGIEVAEVAEPPLEDFPSADEVLVSVAQWKNKMLIEVKNRTIPKVLREASTGDLRDLLSRIEKFVLDLNYKIEQFKNSSQARGETKLDEGVILFQERIGILKAILEALKEEIANRSR